MDIVNYYYIIIIIHLFYISRTDMRIHIFVFIDMCLHIWLHRHVYSDLCSQKVC